MAALVGTSEAGVASMGALVGTSEEASDGVSSDNSCGDVSKGMIFGGSLGRGRGCRCSPNGAAKVVLGSVDVAAVGSLGADVVGSGGAEVGESATGVDSSCAVPVGSKFLFRRI